MADVLAISTAVTQFLDIAIRLSLQLSRLYKEVRDVPEKLQTLNADLNQQVAVARYVQSRHAAFWHSSPAASASAMPVADQALADYVAVMEQLLEVVEVLANPDSSAGIMRKSWNALRATQKCREAVALCDTLVKKKSNITLWLCTANAELSLGIKGLVEGVQSDVDETLQLTRRLEETSAETKQPLSQIPVLFDLLTDSHRVVTELSHNTTSAHRRLLASAVSTETYARALAQQWQELSPTFHEFRDILQRSTHLQQCVRQLARGNEHSRQKDYNDVTVNGNTAATTRQWNSCTCREVARATSAEPLSFLHFRKVFRRHHYRDCPRSKTSTTSLEYLIRIVPPTWLLSHTVHLGFSIHYWNSKRSWKISPLLFGTSRVVDSARSPAFQAVENVIPFNFTKPGILPAHIKGLERTLRGLLESRQASVYDEDIYGSTLLVEVLKLYSWRRRGGGKHDQCGQEFLSLVQFLLDCGSNPNVHRQVDDPMKTTELIRQGGTVLDIFAIPLMCQNPHFYRDDPVDVLVYECLVDSGAQFSRPLAISYQSNCPVYYCRHFEQEVKQLKTFKEQLEVCDLNNLMVAIIQRSEADFARAIIREDIHEVSGAIGLTAIHFAIYWPWALRQLIEAGADVNCQDSPERRPIQLAAACHQAEAVGVLLEADCSIATPNYSYSLLQESLSQGRDFDNATGGIIDALINRHCRLVDLALSVLPKSYDLKRQLSLHSLDECLAPRIIDALAELGCRIPPALEVDRDGERVYDTASLHADIRLTPHLADQLFDGGFHRVNDPAVLNGLTPLLQSWFTADLDMVSWFVGKGVSPFSKSRRTSHSGLHLYAARMAYPGAHFNHDHRELPYQLGLFEQLTDDENMWHDACCCPCSPNGCTPISILVKQWFGPRVREYRTALNLMRELREKGLYRPEEKPEHAQQLLEAIVFDKLNIRHSCCHIGQEGQTETWEPWQAERRDFGGLEEAEYRQSLARYASRMQECSCIIAEKPVCAVFHKECRNRNSNK